MTLPTGQGVNTIIVVEKADSTANTVTASGSIRGVGSSTLAMSLAKESILFLADASGSWWPIAGHKTLGSLDARFGTVLTDVNNAPAITGDGSTNDAPAITALYAATPVGSVVRFGYGKTYVIGSSVTFTRETDLNGATLNVTGRLIIQSHLRNGTVSVSDKVYATGTTNLTVKNLTVTNGSAGNGITVDSSQNVRILDCTVTGGTRGIILNLCDRFSINGNTVSSATAAGSYGILVTGSTGTSHGNGSITNNVVTDCFYGINANGGEANPANGGFASDYTLTGINISGNTVISTLPDTYVGCIYATRATGLTVNNNVVTGGKDVGVDFEYCTKSSASGNKITDIINGGLSAIFGSTDILFEDNTVVYSRTHSASGSTSTPTWVNTGPTMVLLRDTPQRIKISGNTFSVANSSLGIVNLAQASGDITVTDNKLRNCYVAGANGTAGNVTDTVISENVFNFDININNPVIYHERVLRFHAENNRINLLTGEVLEAATRKFVTVYDAAGGGTSNYVYILRNTVDDKGISNAGIGVHTTATGIQAWVTGNLTNAVTAFSATYTALIVDANAKIGSAARCPLTTHDTAAAITTLPAVDVFAGILVSTSGSIAYKDGVTAIRVDSGRNVTLNSNSPSYGSGGAVTFVGNTTGAPSTNPTGGGVLYAHAGAARWRTSNGSVVTIGGDTTSVSTNTTPGANDRIILATAGAGGITVTLPAAVRGLQYEIIKVDSGAGNVSIASTSSQTINGAAASGFALSAQWSTLNVVSDGTNWIKY